MAFGNFSNLKGLFLGVPWIVAIKDIGQWSDPPLVRISSSTKIPSIMMLSEMRNLSKQEEISLSPPHLLFHVKVLLFGSINEICK